MDEAQRIHEEGVVKKDNELRRVSTGRYASHVLLMSMCCLS